MQGCQGMWDKPVLAEWDRDPGVNGRSLFHKLESLEREFASGREDTAAPKSHQESAFSHLGSAF